MLLAAIAVLGAAVIAGGWLGAQVLLLELPPALGVHWKGLAHGAAGLGGLVLLVLALRQGEAPLRTARAVRMGAGGFGQMSGALIAGAALAGLTILLVQLLRRPLSPVLIGVHGLLAIVGYTLLMTYLTMLH